MHPTPRLARSAHVVAVLAVMAYGALLRFDAISQRFDPVSTPQWLHRLETARAGRSRLRPAAMSWEMSPRFPHKDGPPSQYRSDPYTYLQYAREMRSFYAAHRREPLFPFATKMSLWLLHDSDAAVSFTSAAFSVAAIALTFMLGAEAFAYAVGLGAALLWAVELDVVTTAADGWRDDAFTCAVLLTAWLALRFDRQPTVRRAVALGAAAGVACLVRITSLSFVVPVLIWLIAVGARGWRQRARSMAIAALVALVVVGPYVFNCWRVFGDPLYSIDVHANVYQTTAGESSTEALSAREYLGSRVRTRPMETLDTVALGLTAYPFGNKWAGFDVWLPALGRVLAVLAMAGLFLFLVLPAGRLLLIVLVTSLVPYSATWRLIFDWRFTEHAYPFFLLAACSVPWAIAAAIRRRKVLFADRSRVRTAAAIWTAAGAVAIAAAFVLTRLMPPRVFAEKLQAGDPATIMAGDRDAAFFTAEWPRLVRTATVATRVTSLSRASILVPLPVAADYGLLLRVDPSTAPLTPGAAVPPIQILVNGRLVGVCDPGSTPDRIGVCRAALPADAVRRGRNRLTVAAAAPGFRVWYVRVTKEAGR